MKDSYRKIIAYITAPVVTVLLICTVFMIKGIFPFGKMTIDYYDMAQQIAAFYYHVYDSLHGTKNFFYDFYTALGVNMAMSTSGCSNISLWNLFFLFVKREYLLESLSVFLVLKMAAMTASMDFYFRNNHRIPYVFQMILSCGYGFCGFVMMLYMTNQWMDIAILLPIIVHFAKKCVTQGKCRGYVIVLSLSVIASYYLSFMILIFLFLTVGLYLFVYRDRKHYVFRFGMSTIASLGISAFILMPCLLQTLSSARFQNENGGGLIFQYLSIAGQVKGAYITRFWALLGLSFAFSIVFLGIIKDIGVIAKWKRIGEMFSDADCGESSVIRKRLIFSLGSLFIIIAELFFESINLIWHFGSYVHYPIRNGFLIYFVVAALAAQYIPLVYKNGKISARYGYLNILVSVIAAALWTLCATWYRMHPGISVYRLVPMMMLLMILLWGVYLFLGMYRKGKYLNLTLIIWALELLLYSYICIGPPTYVTGYSEGPEMEGEYIRICNELSGLLPIGVSNTDRIKNPDESLNANYGLVLRRPTLSNWTHLISPNLQDGAAKMGYSCQYTRLLDAGGTVFSDALLHITNVISCNEQDESLYTPVQYADVTIDHMSGEEDRYYYYDTKYCFPFVYGAESTDTILSAAESQDIVTLYNAIYDEIAPAYVRTMYPRIASSPEGDVTYLDGSMKVDGRKAVYLYGDCVDCEYRNTEIFVNGSPVPIPSIKETDNTLYPAYFNNNAVYLGTFMDEEFDLSVDMDVSNMDEIYSVRLFMVDMDALTLLCEALSDIPSSIAIDGSHISAQYTATEGVRYALLPLSYNEGFAVTVNGQSVTPVSVLDMFTAIPVTEGTNDIEMKFLPSGMKTGVIISAAALIVCLLVTLAGARKREEEPNVLDRVCTVIYRYVWILAVVLVYVFPIVYGLLRSLWNVLVN